MAALRVLSILIMVAGFSTSILARFYVKKFALNEKTRCNFEHEMNEEELTRYKMDKAVVNLKMSGLLIALPGLIMFLVYFR